MTVSHHISRRMALFYGTVFSLERLPFSQNSVLYSIHVLRRYPVYPISRSFCWPELNSLQHITINSPFTPTEISAKSENSKKIVVIHYSVATLRFFRFSIRFTILRLLPDCVDSTFFKISFVLRLPFLRKRSLQRSIVLVFSATKQNKGAKNDRNIPPFSSHKAKQLRFTCNISPSLWRGAKQACDKCNISRSPGKIGESSCQRTIQ